MWLVPLDAQRDVPLYEQLYAAVRLGILAGTLPARTRLPSTRAWSQMLGVSRFTVVEAMERLVAEGYLVPQRGSGTFVAAALPDRLMRSSPSAPAPRSVSARPAPPVLSRRGTDLAGVSITGPRYADDGPRPFHPRRPPLDIFPHELWQRAVRRQWTASRFGQLDYADPAGHPELRRAIAEYIGATRGVRCAAHQVIVTSGSQQAFDLLFRLLLDPGQQAWIEEPGYLDVRAALVAAGATLVPVGVDADGLNVDEGLRLAPRAALAVVSPSHQYPIGATLSAPRRGQLLHWARTRGAWIVEDDYDSYFRYRGRPMSALQGLDSDAPPEGTASANVVYVGTFSKTMFPALRLGFCVVPEPLVDAVRNAKAIADRHSPTTAQAALAAFIQSGDYDRHLRRVRQTCAERYEAMTYHFERRLGDLARLSPATAGTHVIARFDIAARHRSRGHSFSADVAATADAAGLVVFPLERYCLGQPAGDSLVLGYGSVRPDAIARGLDTLRRCVDRVRSARRRAQRSRP
jgi:GntR family transcriptional regulator/MocR family aminotransferase